MRVRVRFFSYFKELAGGAELTQVVPEGSTLGDLLKVLIETFPKLEAIRNSALLAVGVEYQPRSYVLRPGDEVSIFPPVQGG